MSGFPPNASVFFMTQCKAAGCSFNPMFPGTTLSSVLRNPSGYAEEEIEMILYNP
jgi:hypothetical protein